MRYHRGRPPLQQPPHRLLLHQVLEIQRPAARRAERRHPRRVQVHLKQRPTHLKLTVARSSGPPHRLDLRARQSRTSEAYYVPRQCLQRLNDIGRTSSNALRAMLRHRHACDSSRRHRARDSLLYCRAPWNRAAEMSTFQFRERPGAGQCPLRCVSFLCRTICNEHVPSKPGIPRPVK